MDRKEQIQRAKELLACGALSKEACDAIKADFPELAENEDERIRSLLYCLIRDRSENQKLLEHNGVSVDKALAYLEKQKEQVSAQTETEKQYVRTLKALVSDFIRDRNPEDVPYYQGIFDWLEGRHIKQKPAELSEKDERLLNIIIDILDREEHNGYLTHGDLNACVKLLKSLRPQPRWKPSDEQIRPLGYAIDYFKKKKNDTTYLESLYNDLKKLM